MAAAKDGRLASVDFWRGVALATIFINHIPGNPLEAFTHKNFGFSDAAEAFVFLAGMGVSFAYLARAEKTGLAMQAAALARRAGKLYLAHLALIVVCGGLLAYAASVSIRPGLIDGTGFEAFWANPALALADVARLSLQPAYFNILPLYVALLLVAPLLIALVRLDATLAIMASITVWLSAHLSGFVIGDTDEHGWYFNPLAWQLIFTLGLVSGQLARRRAKIASKPLTILAMLYLVAAAVWVRSGASLPAEIIGVPAFLVEPEKANVSLPRLLHALALFYLVSRLPLENILRRAEWASPFVMMGRHSLPVFCALSVLSFAAQIARNADENLATWDVTIVGSGLLALVLFAWALDRNSAVTQNGKARAV